MSLSLPGPRALRAAVLPCVAACVVAPTVCAQSAGTDTNRTDAKPASGATAPTAAAPTQRLGVVTIESSQPSSLPVNIPTTVESITGDEITRRINATDAPDALKYFPSLLVRKRYIGDYDHAVLSTRASGTGNSARSLVYADGVLLSNLLGNGAFFTPRWGLVTPQEIERVDVLYGPFSAAYPGNSVGAVVDYVTRMPQSFEGQASFGVFSQPFKLFNTDATYGGHQASASLGNRHGDWSWFVNVRHLDSEGQPLVFATRTLSQGQAGTAGVPVSGAVPGLNRSNQPWVILGTSSQAATVQDNAKAKVQWQVTPTLRAAYSLGWWSNDVQRETETFLRDAAGQPVYSGVVNINGRSYTLAAADFPQTREDLRHVAQALTLQTSTRGSFDWSLAASVYDYQRDIVRAPTVAPPLAFTAGAGRITRQDGTGWWSLAARGIWRPDGVNGTHVLEGGVQSDRFRLRNEVFNTGQWITGGEDSLNSAFRGDAALNSIWVQDLWRLSARLKAVLGLRLEQWEASDGASTATVTPPCAAPPCPPRLATVRFGDRTERYASPKAALGYEVNDALVLKLSLGRAVRMPTVSELFQGGIANTGTLVNNDPNLRPERSWTGELSAEYALASGKARATLFHERTSDALYSQTNVLVIPNITTIQNVGRIETSGIELALQASDFVQRGFDLGASVTYADSVIKSNPNFPASVGKQQPRVPRWRANLLATWRPTEQWSATYGARYGGRQFNTLDNSDPNGSTWQGVSSFFTTDVRVVYQPTRRWTLALGIDNLNNAKYWNFHPYPQRTYLADIKANF
jgi:iron complex outermembrane receptor protein